jgi:hypothetical protein
MADDTDVAAKTKRTVTLSHRQIGATGLIGLAVALAPYLKETFVTREEGAQVAIQLEYMRKDITEIKISQDKNTERIVSEIRESDRRTEKNADRIETRVDNLEASIRPRKYRSEN